MSSREIPNLDPDQLDFFLGIVTDRTYSTFNSSDDQAVVDLVHKVLTSPLGNHSVFPGPLQDRLRHFTQAFSDRSLIDMVLDSSTEPVILKAISYCAQEYSFHVSTQAENAIAITIYYAATASLLVHHHKEIAEHSYENLIESFTDLMKKSWLVPTLKPHLDRACKICQQRKNSQETDRKRLSDEELLKLDSLPSGRKSTSTNATFSLDTLVDGVGGWIGRYKLLHVLGEGGMGIVYLAEQEEPINRQVALKVIKPGMDSERVIARFGAERQALALLDHPNIAHIHEAGTTDSGRPYFVMEYVEGLPITEHCDHHKLTIEERLDLFLQICHAVHHAHQKGIIHRDIKPSNILISTQDDQAVPKIIDFGVAKALAQSLTERTLVTEQGQLFGTPEYMSPEQADMANEDIDTRSDIYSLGVLLYVLLTGVLPFDSTTFREGGIEHIRQIICEADPMTPSTRLTKQDEAAKMIAKNRQIKIEILTRRLHRELEWIPLKAMRKERARRYQSAMELADDIENYLRGDPLIAGPESTIYRVMKMFRKHRVPFAAGVITVGSLVVGLVISALMYFHAEHARTEAQAVSDLLQKSITSSLNLRQVTGKEITARSILDTISENLEVELQNQPLFGIPIQNELISAYGVLGLHEQAELHAERAIEIRRALLGTENIATLHSLYQLGWIYMLQGRYSEAGPLLTKTLTGFKVALDEEHPDRLWCMAFLGWVYFYQSRIPEAKELFKNGLEAAQRTRGTEHPVAPFLVFSWAFTHQIQGRYREAERLYLRGLEISRHMHGELHDDTLRLMQGLGALYLDMGRYEEAEEFLQAALKVRREVWDETHQETLWGMVELGWLYYSQGRYKEAEELLCSALETARQVLGATHSKSMYAMHSLGTLYLSQNQYDKAELLLAEAFEIARSSLGEDNWFTLWIMNTLARLYTAQGRYEEADNMFQQTLTARRRIWDANHPEIYETMNDLGVLYRIQGRYDDAKDLLNKALEGKRRKLGGEHPETLRSMNDLAVLYKEQGRYEKAEEYLLQALKGRRLKLGDTHPYTLESLRNLINLYEAWNKPEKAKEWRTRMGQIEDFEK
jgi:serine/threonine protein kinase/Tfp pilus assembly protein PilF